MRASTLVVEPTGQKDFGPCECCGTNSRTVWGFVHEADRTIASYFVHWTLGQVPQRGADVDLVLGKWGEGASPSDRVVVALRFRRTEEGPSFMVVDASGKPSSEGGIAAAALARHEVLGSPWEHDAYDVLDAVWLKDARISEIVAVNGPGDR